jgi:hypothetical protein
MAVFWVVAPCSLVVYQGFEFGKLLPDYMALQPRRQPSLFCKFGKDAVCCSSPVT